MKTSLLGNCAKGILYLPNSLARVFRIFLKLAIILASINWQKNKVKKSAKPMLFMKILPLSLSGKVVEN